MKNTCFLFFILLAQSTFTQNENKHLKHDYVWYGGQPTGAIDSYWVFGGSQLDFNNTPMKISQKYNPIDLNSTAVNYCDRQGKLRLISNGTEVLDSTFHIMENGTGIIAGDNSVGGTIDINSMLALEYPNDSNKVILVYGEYKINDTFWTAYNRNLYYSIVDLTLNNGRGKITQKNILFYSGLISSGHLTACRHANGKDWWIAKPGIHLKEMYTFLLTAEGVNTIMYNIFQQIALEMD